MKQEMVGDVPGNILGMLADLAHKLQHGVILPEELGRFLKRQNPLKSEVDLTTNWEAFYHNFFSLDLDFSNVHIPESRPGFDRLIVVAQGLTPNQVLEACQQNFKCWRYTKDLDKATYDLNEREPTNSYAIWVRDCIEADEEHKNKSASQIKVHGITTETLLERLIHELKFFHETGGHLDIKNVTLCAGSRFVYGLVSRVFRYDDKLYVHGYNSSYSYDLLRSREVVS